MSAVTSTPKKKNNRIYVLLLGFVLILVGIAGWRYAVSPLGYYKVASPVGGPGPQITLEIPKKLRRSETGVVRVGYSFSSVGSESNSKTITMTLKTVSFELTPISGKPIAKRVEADAPYEWIWVIRPTEVGQHYVVLEAAGIWGPLLSYIASDLEVDQLPANSLIMDTANWSYEQMVERSNDPNYVFPLTIPIEVVDILGLTAIQAKIVSSVFTLLGSGISFAWLYLRWQERRSERRKTRRPRRHKRRR